jgi:muramoyltetrapeptide carboxypeptidase
MRPPFVQSGDTIALICTARWLSDQQCTDAREVFEAQGLLLKVGPHATTQHFQLAGSADQRLADLQWALDDPQIKAVIIGRGGYGTVQLLDELEMHSFLRNPKWVVGFSDATSLLAHINTHGVQAIHGSMPVQFPTITKTSLQSLFDALKGVRGPVHWSGQYQGTWPWKAPGMLLGGNLSVLCSILDSPSWQPKEPYYLLIEDLDEMLYHLDRMLHAIGRSASASGIRGVLVGGLSDFKDNTTDFGFDHDNPWGATAIEIILKWAEKRDWPVITGFPVGHQKQNEAVYLGQRISIEQRLPDAFSLNWEDESSWFS